MPDVMEKIGRSIIQHGPDNDRIYLMKLSSADAAYMPARLDELAAEHGYSKIFAKVPESLAAGFESWGYQREGYIPGFYEGREGAAFLGKFLDESRGHCAEAEPIRKTVELAQQKAASEGRLLPVGYRLREAVEEDVEAMAAVYRIVFASYPFPIHNPAYLLETMQTHVCYFVAEYDGQIIAASSGEMDLENKNAEMTDFATVPDHRGSGLAVHLLRRMEPVMRDRGMLTLYTIARAMSPGMNITFARCGYEYGGTLVHNTQISGRIESMNLWFRIV